MNGDLLEIEREHRGQRIVGRFNLGRNAINSLPPLQGEVLLAVNNAAVFCALQKECGSFDA